MVSEKLKNMILDGKVKGSIPDKKDKRKAYARSPLVDENVD
jgi:hypothetical protein